MLAVAAALSLPSAATAAPRGVVMLPMDDEAIGAVLTAQRDGRLLVTSAVNPRGRARYGVARLSAHGVLDRRFGTRGVALALVGKEASMHDPTATVVRSDGRILVGGNVDMGSNSAGAVNEDGSPAENVTDGSGAQYGFLRLTAAGKADPAFGGGDGILTAAGPAGLSPSLQFMVPRGADLLFGGAGINSTGPYGCVHGLNADLSAPTAAWADSCWRPAGLSTAEFGQASVLGDGKIVVSGRGIRDVDPSEDARDFHDVLLLARFNRDGTPDATFGEGGAATLDLGPRPDEVYPNTFLLGRDGGGWIVAATTGDRLFMAGFTPAGQLDPAFGTGGQLHADVESRPMKELAVSLERAPGGGFFVAGTTNGRDDIATLVARFDAKGQPVRSFGRNGRVALRQRQLGYYGDATADLVAQRNGSVVVLGTGWDVRTSRRRHATLFRLDKRGRLDRTFGQAKKPKKKRRRR